jgi:hypothetical protein
MILHSDEISAKAFARLAILLEKEENKDKSSEDKEYIELHWIIIDDIKMTEGSLGEMKEIVLKIKTKTPLELITKVLRMITVQEK